MLVFPRESLTFLEIYGNPACRAQKVWISAPAADLTSTYFYYVFTMYFTMFYYIFGYVFVLFLGVSGPWDLDGWIRLKISVQMTPMFMDNGQI